MILYTKIQFYEMVSQLVEKDVNFYLNIFTYESMLLKHGAQMSRIFNN